jgi:hypothetical protein
MLANTMEGHSRTDQYGYRGFPQPELCFTLTENRIEYSLASRSRHKNGITTVACGYADRFVAQNSQLTNGGFEWNAVLHSKR